MRAEVPRVRRFVRKGVYPNKVGVVKRGDEVE